VLEEKRLRNDGAGAARSEQAGQGREEVDEKNDQIAHQQNRNRTGNPKELWARLGTYLYIKDGWKRLRTRPPDRNGGAIRPGSPGQAPAQRLRSQFGTPAFPFLVQDACGPRDGRRHTRKAGASDAAR